MPGGSLVHSVVTVLLHQTPCNHGEPLLAHCIAHPCSFATACPSSLEQLTTVVRPGVSAHPARSPRPALRCGNYLCLSMHQSGISKVPHSVTKALRAVAGALAPSHATIIREQWSLPGAQIAAGRPAACTARQIPQSRTKAHQHVWYTLERFMVGGCGQCVQTRCAKAQRVHGAQWRGYLVGGCGQCSQTKFAKAQRHVWFSLEGLTGGFFFFSVPGPGVCAAGGACGRQPGAVLGQRAQRGGYASSCACPSFFFQCSGHEPAIVSQFPMLRSCAFMRHAYSIKRSILLESVGCSWHGKAPRIRSAAFNKSGAPDLLLPGLLVKIYQQKHRTPGDKATGKEHFAVSSCTCILPMTSSSIYKRPCDGAQHSPPRATATRQRAACRCPSWRQAAGAPPPSTSRSQACSTRCAQRACTALWGSTSKSRSRRCEP